MINYINKINEMNELITVIVPVYNVEKYINRCINSIINQTYRNLEIILVDDGSTDNSGNICEEYKNKDDRIKVIHKKNEGVSSARNIGMNFSNGKYIIFIDSDDWIEKKMINILYKNIINYDADISICEYYINENRDQYEHNNLKEIQIIDNKNQMYEKLFQKNLYGGYLWNKLIKREIIKEKFNENVAIQEDTLFLIDVIGNSRRIIYDPNEKLYHYRKRKNSSVVFKYEKKDLSKIYVLDKIIKLKNELNLSGLDKVEYDYYILARKSKYILKKENMKDDKLKEKINNISQEYFYKAIKSANFRERIKIILLTTIPCTYGMILDKLKNRYKCNYKKI